MLGLIGNGLINIKYLVCNVNIIYQALHEYHVSCEDAGVYKHLERI